MNESEMNKAQVEQIKAEGSNESPQGSPQPQCKDEDMGLMGGENPEIYEDEGYIFLDMATRTDWIFNEMTQIPNRREALI